MGCRTLNILFVYKDSSTYQRYNYFSYQAHYKDRRVTKVIDKDTNNIGAYIKLGQVVREGGNPKQALKIHKSLVLRKNLIRCGFTIFLGQRLKFY